MHPSSLLSYYPTYAILDEVLSYGQITELNLFFDLKNNLQTLYLEHAIKNVVETTIKAGRIDTSVFSSVMSFLAYHKLYAIKRKIKVNFYTFFESGVSYYHTNLDKKYKISRRTDDLYGLDREKRELFFTIFHKNLMLVEKALNKIPQNKVIRMTNLEADFIPYYLVRNSLVPTGENVANIVYSNDHDLLQCTEAGKNVYIFQKGRNVKRLVRPGNIMETYFKVDLGLPDSYFSLACSITGDSGDDITGVKGIAQKRAIAIINDVVSMVGGIDALYDNVFNRKPIFTQPPTTENKYINDVVSSEQSHGLISRNLQLISFEMLSRFVDDPPSIEMDKKRQHIINTLKPSETAPIESMREALDKVRVELQEDDLEVLYYGS